MGAGLPARLAARRRAGRRHHHGVPHPPGDGLRRGRPAAGRRRHLGVGRRAARLRRPGLAAALASLGIASSTRYAELAAALALVVAGICVLGWLGGLGFLADLLSRPVLIGYMAGVAAIMVASQLGKLTGIPVEAEAFVPQVREVVTNLDQVHTPTLVLGLVTLVVMLIGSAFFPRAPMALIGMLGAAAAVALLDLQADGVTVIGTIPAGLPVPSLPRVSFDAVV